MYKNKSHISQLFFLMGSDPNWRSSTILKEKKGKSIYISPLYYEPSQSAQAWITQFYLQIHHACLSFTAFTRCHYPRLTCSRWLTHMSSHPSLGVKRRIGKVCRPKTDVLTTVPRHQPRLPSRPANHSAGVHSAAMLRVFLRCAANGLMIIMDSLLMHDIPTPTLRYSEKL